MSAKWITATPSSEKISLYIFKKSFTANENVKSFSVRISADTRYRFYLNGKELANGPCKSSPFVKYYEEFECSDSLILGENEIKVMLLHVPPKEGSKFTTVNHKVNPALLFDGTLTTESHNEKIISDENFSVFRATHVSYTYHTYCMPTIGPFEIVDGDEGYEKLECKVLCTPNFESNGYNSWGIKDEYKLEARPIQILEINPKTKIKQVREYYGEDGNYNIILDPETYTTAMVRYELCAPKGTKINLVYSECPLTLADDGTSYKDMRDNADGIMQYGIPYSDHYDEVTATGCMQIFEPFWYRVYRFIRVEFTQKPESFSAYAARYTYDFEKDAIAGGIGSFKCSDEKYAKLWEVSRNTLECCTHETFSDCPFHEQQQYIGDGRFESLYAWKLSNDSRMQRKLLVDTLHSLQTDGQIATTSPCTKVQIIHISSFYFINLIREYLRFTGDSDFVKTLIGVIACNIGYFESTKTCEGLINPPDGCRFIDWVSSWENGFPKGGDKAPMTIYNLMYASSLKDAAEICESCGYKGLADDYKLFYTKTVGAINKHCFDEETGLYVDVPGEKTYSEHAGVWAVLSDAITGKAAQTMIEKMFNSDFVAKSSFSKKYDLLRALNKTGLYEKFAPDILKQWDSMLEKHCTTWCESTSFPRSECHGWSCAPLYEMSAQILGVTPCENGFKKIKIKPHLMGLNYASGRVPTPFGYIDVSWASKGGEFSLEVSSNTQIEMEIILPSGKSVTTVANKYNITE
ncbi:MAG: hypothetical protein E7390_09205 [Ruminococcaceae bacterium]|nr:hypothetical protein [Oscillospiraceae bacterium]